MKEPPTAGSVTIRSNVVLDPGRWDLVPGELLYELRRMDRATRLQRDEHMYYAPCSICRRTIVEINLNGCSQCAHSPSPAAVEREQGAYYRRVEEALQHEREENGRLGRASSQPARRDSGSS
jgi:hypothetical protein